MQCPEYICASFERQNDFYSNDRKLKALFFAKMRVIYLIEPPSSASALGGLVGRVCDCGGSNNNGDK